MNEAARLWTAASIAAFSIPTVRVSWGNRDPALRAQGKAVMLTAVQSLRLSAGEMAGKDGEGNRMAGQ
jgi:hypothetical protein